MTCVSLRPLAGLLLLLPPVAASASEGGLQLLPELPAPVAELIGGPAGWGTISLIVLFVVLVVPVNQLVFKPLLRVLDEREEKIAGKRARAQQLQREADEVLGRYESQVAAVREEAEQERRGLLEGARSDAQGTTGGARAEAEGEIERARREIAGALDEARGSLRSQAEDLARQAATRVLGRPL